MTNIDRAARMVWDASRAAGEPLSAIASDYIAAALADAGLLMPDLPEPTLWEQNEEPIWEALGEKIQTAGYEGGVIVEDGDDLWKASVVHVREYAYALLAAAKYAEENA